MASVQHSAPVEPASAPSLAPEPPPPALTHPAVRFEAALRVAIEAALRYPESARMEGITGRTLVRFVYRYSTTSDIHVATSSGIGQLDRAALAAVRDATCQPPPRGFDGKSLPEQLWVESTLDS
ncbi:energy transducer TonB [Paraburkholderia sejongensis]|uniref:energy transducer TonB n=1 Tax=Paraburkholderia sejongensis TaxID=2886946 RepID=UPI003CE47647